MPKWTIVDPSTAVDPLQLKRKTNSREHDIEGRSSKLSCCGVNGITSVELGLCVTDSAFENAENAAIELLLLLVRVHREAGSPHAQALAERGLAAFEATERRGVVHHVARILFARLPAGGPLHASDAEKQAAWDAMRG